jgi:hypothetical protein
VSFSLGQLGGFVCCWDKHTVFHAAAHAQRAADFLHKLQPVIAEQDNRPITLLPGLIAKTLPEALTRPFHFPSSQPWYFWTRGPGLFLLLPFSWRPHSADIFYASLRKV